MLRRFVAALFSTAGFMWTLHASALGDVTIYDNAQSVPIGGRAAGVGGAYTALACDEGALHYNPASLSCAAASHLELTANAYVLQGLRATGALGCGRIGIEGRTRATLGEDATSPRAPITATTSSRIRRTRARSPSARTR